MLRVLGRAANSGVLVALFGGVSLFRSRRAFRDGYRERGFAEFALGAVLFAIAYDQWRSRNTGRESDLDQTDVVDTGSNEEAFDAESDAGGEADAVGGDDHAVGEAAEAVVDTGPDVEAASAEVDTDAASVDEDESDAASVDEDESDAASVGEDESETVTGVGDPSAVEDEIGPSGESASGEADHSETLPGDVDRLGEAAFDAQSREVPVPQGAFNQGFLSHGAEAFWGVRESDDAVVVSRDYDSVAGREGARYVASSEIAADARELPIPDAVLDHWDDVYGGGTAVVGGDDVLFVTTDDLSGDHLLRVLPASWAEEPTT